MDGITGEVINNEGERSNDYIWKLGNKVFVEGIIVPKDCRRTVNSILIMVDTGSCRNYR